VRRAGKARMSSEDPAFEALLRFLREERGFDFTGYKRPSLVRRVARRMQLLNIPAFPDYQAYLEVHPEEFGQLFNAILINVTSFFRDPAAWESLRQNVLPRILAGKTASEPVRIWSAGCASGEEVYTLAMVFAEAMGREAFRERVKIYGTDVDEEALAHARLGAYAAKDLEGLDPALRDRYFEPVNSRFAFRNELRRALIFGRHDLVQDAPISRLDLLVCRNTLMYFNAEAQAKILQRLHFALNGDGRGNGALFLGRAEMLLAQSSLFAPLDLKCRIFAKVPAPASAPRFRLPVTLVPSDNDPEMIRQEKLRELALEEAPMARIVVDADGVLVSANARARVLFTLAPRDIGRPVQDLEVNYRPLELRAPFEQAYAEKRAVTLSGVERRFPGGEAQYFDIVVTPLFDGAAAPLGVAITFLEVTRYTRLAEEVRRSREEIQTTNEELQSANEELETTNEELQSSNEELETTNEELQSTNEELETMNEELQSTNEELQTVNEELRTRTEELNHLNSFFEAVLGGLRSGAVVVTRNLDVSAWNPRAEDMWGLRGDEVQGKSLLNLDIGLPVKELRDAIRPVLSGEAEHQVVVLDAINRRGKAIHCRVTCTPLRQGNELQGVILLMDEV
jgi:two-component system, chemotaxis family, CheB/CheR fusion protein